MKTPGIKGFIFDMDGVLVDNAHFHTRAWLALFDQLGISVDPQAFHLENAGQTNPAILHWKLGNDLNDEQIQSYAERKEAIYRELYRPHLQPLAGLLPFLEEANLLEIPLALATSADKDNISLVLDGLDLRRFFPIVVGGAEIEHSKPHPQILLTAAARLGLPADSCVVFEDSLAGVQAARRAGMRLVLIATSLDGREPIERYHPDFIAHDFTTLDPKEILSDCFTSRL